MGGTCAAWPSSTRLAPTWSKPASKTAVPHPVSPIPTSPSPSRSQLSSSLSSTRACLHCRLRSSTSPDYPATSQPKPRHQNMRKKSL
ncbi:hypothetical protein PR202_gb12897 [Eleusine coracana subsp. coracana]|uniref:Uncharacterized protein n=1 Tax=Eleusine coracana subsp. coracana TaxID=191504 RepID=A0AAV5ESB8_ELECO|nr:hypothetical protein PR202_gb12897 [Eleusine coracana subsp. coracana]